VLGQHVLGEARRLLRGGLRAEALTDRHDVVVDGLGQSDDGELGALGAEVRRQVGRRGVGVVAADGVQDVHSVGLQARGRDGECGVLGADEAALAAVGVVGELDPAVADRAAAEAVQHRGAGSLLGPDHQAVAGEQAVVAVLVGDQLDVGVGGVVGLDEGTYGRGQARGISAGREEGNASRHGSRVVRAIHVRKLRPRRARGTRSGTSWE